MKRKREMNFASFMNFLNLDSSGIEIESDYSGRGYTERRAALSLRHPFDRNERYRDEPPRVIRWMWDPETGDALLGTSGRHADILRRHKRTRKVAGFSLWLRGFFFPRTGELVMRPYDVGTIGWDDDWTYSDRMQRHARKLIERQLGRRIPERRFFMNVDNEWLTARYGGRW